MKWVVIIIKSFVAGVIRFFRKFIGNQNVQQNKIFRVNSLSSLNVPDDKTVEDKRSHSLNIESCLPDSKLAHAW